MGALAISGTGGPGEVVGGSGVLGGSDVAPEVIGSTYARNAAPAIPDGTQEGDVMVWCLLFSGVAGTPTIVRPTITGAGWEDGIFVEPTDNVFTYILMSLVVAGATPTAPATSGWSQGGSLANTLTTIRGLTGTVVDSAGNESLDPGDPTATAANQVAVCMVGQRHTSMAVGDAAGFTEQVLEIDPAGADTSIYVGTLITDDAGVVPAPTITGSTQPRASGIAVLS